MPGVASELARGPRVVLATDAAPIRRADSDPKAEVERLLAKRFEVRRAVLGEGRTQLRADEEALSEVEALVTGADCVVALGSGTVIDICKEATARVG